MQPLIPYVREDFELASFCAQICARAGEREEAIAWLRLSVEHGNYDLIQMRHSDFKELQNDPRFSELRTTIEQRAAGILDAIRRWQVAARSR